MVSFGEMGDNFESRQPYQEHAKWKEALEIGLLFFYFLAILHNCLVRFLFILSDVGQACPKAESKNANAKLPMNQSFYSADGSVPFALFLSSKNLVKVFLFSVCMDAASLI